MDDSDLILALMQDGIEPTPEAVLKLDADITELAELLVDWYQFKKEKEETLKNARIGLIAELKTVVQNRSVVRNDHPGSS